MKRLAGLIGLGKVAERQKRARLRLETTADTVIYAIGDVHGCLNELLALEQAIMADATRLAARKLIIMLGDYVDRGPAAAQVLDHLIAPPPAGFERICLAGNHEMQMLDYAEGRSGLPPWLAIGAAATLHSYGIDPQRLDQVYRGAGQADEIIRKTFPAAHLAFLRSLPVLVETPRYIFVHAGFRPDLELGRQPDEDLITIRSAFYERAHLLKKYVVHGHTPVEEAERDGARINIDTGACFTGRLTALRIWQDKGRYLSNK